MRSAADRPRSALPSTRARALAFVVVLVGGVCGGIIGSSLVNVQCRGDCVTASGVGAIVGALGAAAGVATVAVLVLRAMGEWKAIKASELEGEAGPEGGNGPSGPEAGPGGAGGSPISW